MACVLERLACLRVCVRCCLIVLLNVSFVLYCVLLYVFDCCVLVIMCVSCEWVSAVCLFLCYMVLLVLFCCG